MKNFDFTWYNFFRRPVLDQGLIPVSRSEINQLTDEGQAKLQQFLDDGLQDSLKHCSLDPYVKETIQLPSVQWKPGHLIGDGDASQPNNPQHLAAKKYITAAVQQHTEIKIAVLKNVNVLMPQGIIWSDKKSEIYKETTMHANLRGSRRFFASSLNKWRIIKSPFMEEPVKTGESCLFLYSPLYTNIFHFVHDLLWKQWAMTDLQHVKNYRFSKTYFGPNLPGSLLRQFLSHLDLQQTIDIPWGVYHFKKLIFPFSNTTYDPFPYAAPRLAFSHRIFNDDFYHWLCRDVSPTPEALAICQQDELCLALLREDASHRNIVNLKAVKSILSARNYVFLNPSDFSLTDQIFIFSKARKIVGVHGASLFNLIWTRVCQHVGEIFCVSHLDQGYRSICGAKKIDYHCIFSKAVPGSHPMPGYQDIEVDLNDLSALLEAMH